MWILYLLAGLFIILGVGIKYFKWYFLISGYNTMSKSKKENVDTKGLGSLIGNFLFVIAGLMIVSGIAEYYDNRLIQNILMLSIFPISIVLIILAQKYDHNTSTKTDKTAIRVFIVMGIIILLSTSFMLYYGAKEVDITIDTNKIYMGGIYSASIPRDKIQEIGLKDTIPKVLNKTNGFNLGYILRGNFNLKELGVSKVYIHENKSPYIVIKTEGKYYIINYKDPNKTIELYEKIK